MVFHYLTFTFTFLFFETGSHSCSLDGCETCNAGEACFEPPALLLALPPAGYQAQSGSGTITRPPNREAVEVGIWRQAGSGIWVPQFWPVCLCDLVELALECHYNGGECYLDFPGLICVLAHRLSLCSSIWLWKSEELLCLSFWASSKEGKAPLGCYQQTVAQLLELLIWLTPAPSFSLGASVERAYQAWVSSPLWWSRAMLWQDCILSSVGDLFFGEYKASN